MTNLRNAILLLVTAATPTSVLAYSAPSPSPSDQTKLADRPNQVRGDEITPDQKGAVDRGLEWLAAHQKPDGSFTGDGMSPHAGITALAGLAFMQAGEPPRRGEDGSNGARRLRFVLARLPGARPLPHEPAPGPPDGPG